MSKKALLVGQFRDSDELKNTITYFIYKDYLLFINYSEYSKLDCSFKHKIENHVKTWSFINDAADIKIIEDLEEVYFLIFSDVIDVDKIKEVFGYELKIKKNILRYTRSFREKNELFDIYASTILDADEILYFNMKKELKLFSPENQLLFRRQGMSFLLNLSRKGIEMINKKYNANSYELNIKIPFYDSFANWLIKRREKILSISIIDELN